MIAIVLQICLASALTITSATSTPNEVQPGERLTLRVEIENNLNQDVENVVVNLGLDNTTSPVPFAPYQSSNEYRIEDISEDDHEHANFDLITFSEAISGTYTLPVKISYELADGTIISSQNLGVVSLIVNAKPKIELSSEHPSLVKGTKEKITIKIVNSGLGESKFLSIKLNSVNGIKLLDSDSVYIGSIDSNDFDSADFNVLVNANAPSLINLPLEIVYTDSMNNQITETKTVTLKVYSTEEAIGLGLITKNNSFLIVGTIFLSVAAYFAYRKIKKRNKNKRDSKQ